MALTPEDVVNKRFQPTKFREGYDQDEVDDFLDEVVGELRRLNAENEELRAQLSGGAPVAAAPAAAETEEESAPIAQLESEPAPAAAIPAPVAAVPAPEAPVAAVVDDETAGTTNLLQLARRLHEEHVREGAEKRDALIAEGHATAARVVAEAEAVQREKITKLEGEQSVLEKKIDELRTFERDYRQKLKGYIEGQLRDLDASGSLNGGSNAAPIVSSFGA